MYSFPRLIHFIFISKDGINSPFFGWLEYISIKSAIINNPEFNVILNIQSNLPPIGDYYKKLLSEYGERIEYRYVENIESFMGSEILYFTHKTDIIRLQSLKEFGGIYLDLDTITNKSFIDFETAFDFIAFEEDDDSRMGTAVLFANKESNIIDKLLELYKKFRSKGRDEYFVEVCQELPWEMYQKGELENMLILEPDLFLWPKTLLNYKGHQIYFMKFFESKMTPFKDKYVYHIWTELNSHHVDAINLDKITSTDYSSLTMFEQLIKKYI